MLGLSMCRMECLSDDFPLTNASMTEPLIFLPGMMCDARLFSPQLSEFSACYSILLPLQTKHACFTEIAESILKEAPPQFGVVGLSMGGITAMEILRLAPGRITRLALLDTNPLPEAEVTAKGREPQIIKALNGGLRDVMRDEMKPSYLSDGPSKAAILDLCMDMAETLGTEVFIRQSRALQIRRDQCETLRKVNVPTLIMCGEDDTLCPLERHTLMHSLIPHSRLITLPKAGHLPTLEQPEQTNLELKTWLMQ